MKHLRKCTALLLAVLMVLALAACGQKDDTAAVDKDLTVNVVSLNGTTGFGMAKLMADSKAGNAALNYSFTVETDPSNATAALVNGTADIAAPCRRTPPPRSTTRPTAPCRCSRSTRAACSTVVTDGTESVTSLPTCAAKTSMSPCRTRRSSSSTCARENGLTVGTDITIDNTYAQPAELNTAPPARVHIAVLPEPMVTIARAANPDLDRCARPDCRVGQGRPRPAASCRGCVVVRKAFADAHPNEVKAFPDRVSGVHRVSDGRARPGRPDDRRGRHLRQGRRGRQGHPELQRLLRVRRADMQAPLTEFLTALSTVAPQSIGGEVPAESFYCILK